MTDIQFCAFIRFLLDDLCEISEETDPEKQNAKLARVIDNLQKTLED